MKTQLSVLLSVVAGATLTSTTSVTYSVEPQIYACLHNYVAYTHVIGAAECPPPPPHPGDSAAKVHDPSCILGRRALDPDG